MAASNGLLDRVEIGLNRCLILYSDGNSNGSFELTLT